MKGFSERTTLIQGRKNLLYSKR